MNQSISGFAQLSHVNDRSGAAPSRLSTDEPSALLKSVVCSLKPVACSLWPVVCSTSVTSQTVADRIRHVNGQDSDEPKTKLDWLYETVVQRATRDIATCTDVNKFMVAMATRVCEDVAIALFEKHWGLYVNANVEQIKGDAYVAYRLGIDLWRKSLSKESCSVYDELASKLAKHRHRQFAFRLMHSLAALAAPNSPVGTFFLSQSELAARCDMKHPMMARRLQNQFLLFKIIEIEQVGTKLQTGKRGAATTYRWLL